MRISFHESDRDPSTPGLPVFFGGPTNALLVDSITTTLASPSKIYAWYDEVKLRLPLAIKDNMHMRFTFISLSTAKEETSYSLERVFAWAWLHPIIGVPTDQTVRLSLYICVSLSLSLSLSLAPLHTRDLYFPRSCCWSFQFCLTIATVEGLFRTQDSTQLYAKQFPRCAAGLVRCALESDVDTLSQRSVILCLLMVNLVLYPRLIDESRSGFESAVQVLPF